MATVCSKVGCAEAALPIRRLPARTGAADQCKTSQHREDLHHHSAAPEDSLEAPHIAQATANAAEIMAPVSAPAMSARVGAITSRTPSSCEQDYPSSRARRCRPYDRRWRANPGF